MCIVEISTGRSLYVRDVELWTRCLFTEMQEREAEIGRAHV